MPKTTEPNWGYFLGIGLQIAIGTVLGLVVGSWLDQRYGWSPWGVLLGILLGMSGGFYLLIKEAIRINKD